jgi:hypothetical protein
MEGSTVNGLGARTIAFKVPMEVTPNSKEEQMINPFFLSKHQRMATITAITKVCSPRAEQILAKESRKGLAWFKKNSRMDSCMIVPLKQYKRGIEAVQQVLWKKLGAKKREVVFPYMEFTSPFLWF